MKTNLECLPCIIKLIFETIKILNLDYENSKKIFYEILDDIKNFSLELSPPEITGELFKKLKIFSKNNDPFFNIKNISNDLIYKNKNLFIEKINSSKDKLLESLKISILGNIIDYGVNPNLVIEDEIKNIFTKTNNKINNEVFEYDLFLKDLEKSRTLLFLTDNAGEIILDCILLETIKNLYPNIKIFLALKSSPILNDVSIMDKLPINCENIDKILESGSIYPGTILNKTNEDFLKYFNECDIVISKGQGNFESLSKDSKKNKKIYFLFLIKCRIIVNDIKINFSRNSNVYDMVLMKE